MRDMVPRSRPGNDLLRNHTRKLLQHPQFSILVTKRLRLQAVLVAQKMWARRTPEKCPREVAGGGGSWTTFSRQSF
jgi:hypothetical protein